MKLEPAIAGFSYHSPLARSVIQFMDRELLSMVQFDLRTVLEFLGLPLGEASADSVVMLVEKVACILKENENRSLSIDMMIQQLSRDHNQLEHGTEPAPGLRQGIFTLLGLLTMLYKTSHTDPTEFFISQPRNEHVVTNHQELRNAELPIGTLIRFFGRFIPTVFDFGEVEVKNKVAEYDANYVCVSTLNAYLLTTIGRVKIVWSDLLSDHLSFDQYSRTLHLFRFPSFCALNYLHEGGSSFFDWFVSHTCEWILDSDSDVSIMDTRFNSREKLRAANNSMHREVLLSYRLLFGQHKVSRDLFNKRENIQASSEGIMDPLLVRLCGRAENAKSLFQDNSVAEQACYDTETEFPFFGPQLVHLQKYACAGKTRRFVDVWYDRRDPAQWLLVWVVVILGSLSLVLSFFQLLVAIIQTSMTVKG
ncbi:MAG: hypothetical protein Q9170_002913 [Blastenia crenularia]